MNKILSYAYLIPLTYFNTKASIISIAISSNMTNSNDPAIRILGIWGLISCITIFPIIYYLIYRIWEDARFGKESE